MKCKTSTNHVICQNLIWRMLDLLGNELAFVSDELVGFAQHWIEGFFEPQFA